jgi:virulence-associated protein VagC
MRAKVTEQGVTLPRQWFPGITEVDILRENDRVVVVPVREEDPIAQLGTDPIVTEVDDASLEHDRYLYGQ